MAIGPGAKPTETQPRHCSLLRFGGAWTMTCVSTLEMPQSLVRALEEDDDVSAPLRKWMAALPLVVDDLARRWSLDLGRAFQPGGSTSWVAPVRNAAGERLVLKLGWRHYEALHEADGLRAWNGDGVVCLFDSLVLAETSALLLEACEPGTGLSEVVPPAEQDAVVAGLLRRVWIEPPSGHRFRLLQTMCNMWADEFEEKYTAPAAGGSSSTGALRELASSCSEPCPPWPSARSCCAPTCTPRTSWPQDASRG